jgi:hypothetical protein
LNLPFIIIDGVGAAESSYFIMAWFARPSFRHLSRAEGNGFLISRLIRFGTCHKLQVQGFKQRQWKSLSGESPPVCCVGLCVFLS